jgi:eukaryotic-like serine/threonine-protein kinase
MAPNPSQPLRTSIASRVTLAARSGLPVGALVALGVLAVGALAAWTRGETAASVTFALRYSAGVGWALAALAAGLCIGVAVGVRRALGEQNLRARTFGAYTLDEKIGEGGMGVVYRASHALLRRPAAIKLLSPERTRAHDLERFEREVQLTSQLTHPNTIAVYDFGRTPEGAFYYAMEYVDGCDLQTLVERDGPQDPARVAHLLGQLTGALAEAHRVGLVHRDVKPANVMLCERWGLPDVIKVLDFGLIKQLGGPCDLPRSAVDQIVGTPLYLSPEALTAPERVDGRSDIYAVGAVGYFLLTGEPPFSGASILEICGHHLHTPPVPPSRRLGKPVPAALEQLILRCLSKSPERRPDAATLEAALRQCTNDTPVSVLAA